MSNYSATVVKITNIRPHSNADRLVVTNIFGNNVIVGKETKIGDLGLFFPLESQIGLEFAQANDLIRRKDENGKMAGGMFDNNRRVRAQKFRGENSMGFFIPLNSLYNLITNGPSDLPLREGDEIEKIGEYVISQKYIPKRSRIPGTTQKKGRLPHRESKIIPDQFRFHFETAQLGKNIHRVQPEDRIVLTWKMHGTSAIAARVRVKRSLSWFERLLRKLVMIVDTEYDYIYASRKVVKNEFLESKNHYYSYDLWTEVGKKNFEGKLHTGETVYYEIVGFTKDGGYIQKDFDYGCDPRKDMTQQWSGEVNRSQNRIFVYRITQTAMDGSVVELQWNQVKDRCKELGVETVPEIYYGVAGWFIPATTDDGIESWQIQFLDDLRGWFVYDQDSQFCVNKVPEEGIVLRIERGQEIEVFKLKSFRFLEGETKALDKGEVDMETEQADYGEEYENGMREAEEALKEPHEL